MADQPNFRELTDDELLDVAKSYLDDEGGALEREELLRQLAHAMPVLRGIQAALEQQACIGPNAIAVCLAELFAETLSRVTFLEHTHDDYIEATCRIVKLRVKRLQEEQRQAAIDARRRVM